MIDSLIEQTPPYCFSQVERGLEKLLSPFIGERRGIGVKNA
jgi:hypothetical protein